ncbi:MAG: c-type cytochrome [Pseudomonadota bacterium]|nr:c-type cytochrome [Pseudomonadota bacterium]
MKSVLIFSAMGLLLSTGAAIADDDELYKTKNCFACHRIDRTTLGPSFRNIAAKYVEEKGADVMLAKKIREGSVGAWGQVPMPPQPQVTEAEALTLARWILERK